LAGRKSGTAVAALACCASFLATAPISGQETVPFDSGLVIRSNTSLVQVRVVAEDSEGRPVNDLQRADFQIEDDRKPQPITLFSADRGTRPALSAASHSPADRSAGSAEAPAGYSLLLLDWLNTRYTNRLFAQEQVLKFLKSVQPRQRFAIYLLDREPRLLHDFTSNMDDLRQAVEDAGVGFPDALDDPPGRFDARYSGRRVGNVFVGQPILAAAAFPGGSFAPYASLRTRTAGPQYVRNGRQYPK
jgi:hypothetical protein